MKDNVKNDSISFRCEKDEKRQIYEHANKNNQSVADYIIKKTINKEMPLHIEFVCRLQTIVNKANSGRIKKKELINELEFLLGEIKWQ